MLSGPGHSGLWLSRITRRSPLQISISRPSRKRFARSVAWSSSSQRIGSKPTKCPSAPIVKARYSAIPKSPDAYWTIAGRENNSVRERTQFQIWSYSRSRTRLTAKRVDDLLKSSAGSAAPPEAFCCGGRNSLCNQPVTVSDLSGSGRSQSKHWNARRPLPPGGSARIKKAPQWGQVARSACPITISFRLSENPSIPETGPRDNLIHER